MLAHLLEDEHGDYATLHNGISARNAGLRIMDNSAFEMFMEDRPMFSESKLLELGRRCKAEYLVMTDYPLEPSIKTINVACNQGPQFHEAGFKTFFVPQSELGDLEDFITAFAFGCVSPHVDMIGVSILAAPHALGIDAKNKGPNRYLSRTVLMQKLRSRGLLDLAANNGKKIHMLGMTDGPREIQLMHNARLTGGIYSWDSSAAVWAGMNGIVFDDSPTGLINGKFETPVDFGYSDEISEAARNMAMHNCRVMRRYCEGKFNDGE